MGPPVPAAPQLSVIVPARDAAATLPGTLDALAAQRGAGSYEVLVVDDGSTDATASIARAREGVAVLEQPALGPAAARNRGAAHARGKVLAFTDADCSPAPGWLAAGARWLAAADLVQGRVVPEPGRPPGRFDRTVSVEGESGLYEAANLLVTREAFALVGGFEAWLEPARGKALAEDVWLGWKARRLGLRTAFCDGAIVFHAVFPRGAGGLLAERRRLRHFPAIAAKVPELRRHFFFARVFLNRRTALFDAALAGGLAAAARRSRAPLLACLPYALAVLRRSRAAPRALVVELAADAVGAAALARGSVAARSPLL
jgi:glycosyltransferase involved in cell wall biosynthesis